MQLTWEIYNFILIQGRQPTFGDLLYTRPLGSNFHTQVSKLLTFLVDLEARLYDYDPACHLDVYKPTRNLEF